MAFEGWLVKFGGVKLPNNYLNKYKDKPNMRTEIDAFRDGKTITLHRTTSPYYKSQITLPIRSLYYGEKVLLKALIDAAMLNKTERKVHVAYWNSEDMGYSEGDFYIADIEYTVINVNEKKLNMRYEAFDIVLTEY